MARRGQSGCGSVCHGPVGYGQAWFGVAGMATHGNFWPGMDGGARFVLAGQAWLGIARRVVVRHGRQGVARSGAVRCVTGQAWLGIARWVVARQGRQGAVC